MSIRRRGNSWRARYRGPDGRERSKNFKRKIDAERWLAEQKARMTRGEWVDPAAAREPVGKIAREWLAASVHLKPKTRASYEWLLDKHVLPVWEKMPIGKVTHERVAQWVRELVQQELSSSLLRQRVFILSAVCEYAIKTGRLVRNPVKGVRLPRPSRHVERVFLTHGQIENLASAAGEYGTFIRFLAYTGLRWGEATALRAKDADLRRKRLYVRRAFSDVEGQLVEGTPKAHQQRTVPLPGFLCDELKSRVARQESDALVFTTPSGHPLRMSNFRRKVWHPAAKAAGLAGLTPHGLRHTAASVYASMGTPPKVVQRILGHASITITMDLYGHLYPDEMDDWAQRLDDQMRADCGQNEDEDLPDESGESS